MTKKFSIKLIGLGLLSWAIPFLASFPFYSQEKGLLIDLFLFKTIMIIIGALVGVILLVLMFKNINTKYLQTALVIGLVWLALNWILDLLILVPMSDINIGSYFTEIGLRYLALPIYSLGIGFALKNK